MSYFKIVQDISDKDYILISTNGYRSIEVARFKTLEEAQACLEYESSEKRNISVYLPDMLISAMDRECREKHIKRSDIVKKCLEERYDIQSLF